MKKTPVFHVNKHTLMIIAGSVWLLAGLNVARMGIISYLSLPEFKIVYPILSIVVFGMFGAMFYSMSIKHSKRIEKYDAPTKPFWYFFDKRSYFIMAFMMSGGIWLRTSGLVPLYFIAFFYTGLGIALSSAGALFFFMYFRLIRKSKNI